MEQGLFRGAGIVTHHRHALTRRSDTQINPGGSLLESTGGKVFASAAERPLPLGYLAKEFRELRLQAEAERQKLGGHEYVFHKEDGKPLDDRDVLRDIIRPAAERLDLYFEGFGWHSFRRQNITLMQEEGATTFEAMEQAGHTRSTMTSHYTVVALTRREQAVRRVQERLFGLPEKKGPTVASLKIVRDNAG